MTEIPGLSQPPRTARPPQPPVRSTEAVRPSEAAKRAVLAPSSSEDEAAPSEASPLRASSIEAVLARSVSDSSSCEPLAADPPSSPGGPLPCLDTDFDPTSGLTSPPTANNGTLSSPLGPGPSTPEPKAGLNPVLDTPASSPPPSSPASSPGGALSQSAEAVPAPRRPLSARSSAGPDTQSQRLARAKRAVLADSSDDEVPADSPSGVSPSDSSASPVKVSLAVRRAALGSDSSEDESRPAEPRQGPDRSHPDPVQTLQASSPATLDDDETAVPPATNGDCSRKRKSQLADLAHTPEKGAPPADCANGREAKLGSQPLDRSPLVNDVSADESSTPVEIPPLAATNGSEDDTPSEPNPKPALSEADSESDEVKVNGPQVADTNGSGDDRSKLNTKSKASVLADSSDEETDPNGSFQVVPRTDSENESRPKREVQSVKLSSDPEDEAQSQDDPPPKVISASEDDSKSRPKRKVESVKLSSDPEDEAESQDDPPPKVVSSSESEDNFKSQPKRKVESVKLSSDPEDEAESQDDPPPKVVSSSESEDNFKSQPKRKVRSVKPSADPEDEAESQDDPAPKVVRSSESEDNFKSQPKRKVESVKLSSDPEDEAESQDDSPPKVVRSSESEDDSKSRPKRKVESVKLSSDPEDEAESQDDPPPKVVSSSESEDNFKSRPKRKVHSVKPSADPEDEAESQDDPSPKGVSSSESEEDFKFKPLAKKLSRKERLKRRLRHLIRKVDVKSDVKLKSRSLVQLSTLSHTILEDLRQFNEVHIKPGLDSNGLPKALGQKRVQRDQEVERLCNLGALEKSSQSREAKSSPSKRGRDRERAKRKQERLADISSSEAGGQSSEDEDDPERVRSAKAPKLKSRNDLARDSLLGSSSSDDMDLSKEHPDSSDPQEVEARLGTAKGKGPSKKSNSKRKTRNDPKCMKMKLSETDSSEAEEKAKRKRLSRKAATKEKDDDDDLDEHDFSDDSIKVVASKRSRRKIKNDSDEDGSHSNLEEEDRDSLPEDSDSDIQVKKKGGKRKKRSSSDDFTSNDEARPKKKRKRIKKNSSSENSNDDDDEDSPSKGGRKDIRKIMSEKKLSQSTKTAAAEERDRRKRMEERQNQYNKTFEIKEGETQSELPLDFVEESKEVLVEVPKALVKKLKPHQVGGIKFMWDAVFESKKMVEEGKTPGGAILAHCMGLGKTLQTITLICTVHETFPAQVSRTLVLCPVNTVKNWEDEFGKWLKGDLEVDVYEMSKEKDNWGRSDRLNLWMNEGGVLIMGYDMFRNLTNEAKKYKKKQRDIFQKSLCDPGPDLVVCDEGHILKNLKSALNKAMNRIKTKRRLLLTGTPLQNNLSEYYAMVNFVKPKLLGTYNEFKNRFVNPIQNGQHSDSTERDVRVMKKRSFILNDLLKGCMQRLDYNVLMPYLQPKHEFVLCICLTDFQKKLYRFYLENFARAGQIGNDGKLEGGKKGGLFYDVQNLSRVWNHPHILAMAKNRADLKAMDESDDNQEDMDDDGNLQNFIDDDEASDTPASSEDDATNSSDDEVRIETEVSKKSTRSQQDVKIVKGLEEAKSDSIANYRRWWDQFLDDDNELDRLENGSKMVLLMDILKECEMLGDKVLVFSQSLLSLDLIEDFLAKANTAGQPSKNGDDSLISNLGTWDHGKDYFRMDGSTPPDVRKRCCNYFNKTTNHRMRLFLISTKAGGLGINLVAANRVIIFDASWNPAHDVQSIFRVYRFGQVKPVYIYRFLAKGTMEEKIYDRQVTKQSLSARVVDEHQIERHFSVNELAELYEFKDDALESRPVPKVPKDRLLGELLTKHDKLIWKYHDHDSLLENQVDENLTEDERKAAWEEFENEKKGLVSVADPALQALLAQNINPQAIQEQYRLQYPELSDEQIIQATRALIMQMQSGIHRRPAYDKSHYQQEMARARQQEKAMYPGMYRKADKFAGIPGQDGVGQLANPEAWQAQILQQQRQYSEMQQQIHQSRMQQMQLLQAQLSKSMVQQSLSQQQEPEEIVLDGAPVVASIPDQGSQPPAAKPSTSRRGRPRLDPDSDLY